MNEKRAPGELMLPFLIKVCASLNQSVFRTNLDETISVVGPIGCDRELASVPLLLRSQFGWLNHQQRSRRLLNACFGVIWITLGRNRL